MSLTQKIRKKRILVVIIWVVILLLMIPAVLGYSGFLTYSTTTNVSSHAESTIANKIVSEKYQQNSTLIVVINSTYYQNLSSSDTAKSILAFQSSLNSSSLKYFSGSQSIYSAYMTAINKEFNKSNIENIRDAYSGINATSHDIFSFPSNFYAHWEINSFANSSIYTAAESSGYNNSNSYERDFISSINNTTGSPFGRVSSAIQNSYQAIKTPYTNIVYSTFTINNYSNSGSLVNATAFYLSENGIYINNYMASAAIHSNDPGKYYLYHYGLLNVPSYLKKEYMAGDIGIINVIFTVKSGTDIVGGKTAGELATPAVENVAGKDLNHALITGNGAISYETSKETAKAGFAFGLIFIFLAIAIFITLVSWKSAILVFMISGIALLLGYTSEYLSGLLFHHVSFIVNYTLTAVILGVSADYFVFIVSRYRESLRAGKTEDEAFGEAVSKSGKSVTISGLTVAFSLFTFYFIPGFRSWGTSLLFAVIFTIILETTLLPAAMSFFGKKLFMAYGMKKIGKDDVKNSIFYKIAGRSVRHKILVIAIIGILGASGIYGFLAVPTSYNFNTGLPQSLSSVHAETEINNNFGDSHLYPVYDVVNLSKTTNANSTLLSDAKYLFNTSGVTSVYGPFAAGRNVTDNNITSYIINGKYAVFTVYLKYNPYSKNAINTVTEMRSSNNFIVGGLTSTIIDEKNANSRIYTELEVLIVAVIGLIIGISFKSWKYPFISLIGVFFSVAWTTSILYFISTYLLHEALIYLIPIILFIILFSLGNDYTVFIISRIREEQKEKKNDEAIKHGIGYSGKVVTSLGLILAVSLGSLSIIPVAFLEELGIAFIISLLIDTFIIRNIYFPAMISILFRDKNHNHKQP